MKQDRETLRSSGEARSNITVENILLNKKTTQSKVSMTKNKNTRLKVKIRL